MKRWMICALVLFFGGVCVWGQEATPEITPQATALPLTETFTSADGQVSFQYPEGWVLRRSTMPDASFTAYLANRDEVFDSPDRVTGEIFVSMAIAHVDFLETDEVDLEGASAFEVAQALRSQYIGVASENDFEFNVGEVTAIFVNQKDAAQFFVDTPLGDNFVLVVDEGFDLISLYAASSADDEIDLWAPTILSIAESLVYDPSLSEEVSVEPFTEETLDPNSVLFSAVYTSEAGNVSISYPEVWFIRETIDSTIDDTWFEIVSSPRSIGRDFPLTGDVILIARIGRVDRIFRGIRSSDITYVEILQALHDGLQAQASEAGSNIYVSEVTDDAEGQYPKAIMLYIDGSEGQLIILVDYGNENIGFFIMKAAPDDLSQYLPLAWGIVDTVQFQEPESD